MVLVGFICGIVVMLPILFVHRRQKHIAPPQPPRNRPIARRDKEHWELTRNFLYYDGTQMPINKEEQYE